MEHPHADYEYRGLMAEAWDVLRGEKVNRADRAFFQAMAATYGEPILDAGCGTGRLLLAYLAQGLDVDGVDLSPEMLAICARQGAVLDLVPRLYRQPLETLALPRHYRTILASSGLLQLIPDPAAADQAMARLVAHLEPGGALVAAFMQLWQPGDPLEWTWEERATRPEDGVQFRRLAHARFNPATSCEDTRNVYQKIVDGVVVAEEEHVRAQATRSYTQNTARALFARAGFSNIHIYGGFTTLPALPGEDHFTVVGVKT